MEFVALRVHATKNEVHGTVATGVVLVTFQQNISQNRSSVQIEN